KSPEMVMFSPGATDTFCATASPSAAQSSRTKCVPGASATSAIGAGPRGLPSISTLAVGLARIRTCPTRGSLSAAGADGSATAGDGARTGAAGWLDAWFGAVARPGLDGGAATGGAATGGVAMGLPWFALAVAGAAAPFAPFSVPRVAGKGWRDGFAPAF